MMLDEPDHQLGVLLGQSVRLAEAARVDHAQERVVAAAPLGDVVKQPGEVQHLGTLHLADQPAAQRVLVRHLGHGEAAQVAHDHENVLVHGVDVVEIVLHLADDAAEGRQVPPQHIVAVHAAQCVGEPAAMAEHADKPVAVDRIAAERRVDAPRRAPQCAQRAGSDPLELGMPLHQLEHLEDRRRLALEQVFVARFQQLMMDVEAVVQFRTASSACGNTLERRFCRMISFSCMTARALR